MRAFTARRHALVDIEEATLPRASEVDFGSAWREKMQIEVGVIKERKGCAEASLSDAELAEAN